MITQQFGCPKAVFPGIGRIAAGLICAVVVVMAISGCTSEKKNLHGNAKTDEAELARIYADIGLGYFKRGRLDTAREKLLKSLELDPKQARAHIVLAQLYTSTEDFQKAEEHYLTALKLQGNDPHLQNNFGVFLCSRNRYQEAEQYFLKAARHPQYRTPQLAYENAGRCAMRVPDLTKAKQYFLTALRIDPKLPKSLYRMAIISFDTGEFLSARAYIQRYFEVGAESPEILWMAIRIEQRLGDRETARQYEERLVKRFGDTEEGRSYLKILEEERRKAKKERHGSRGVSALIELSMYAGRVLHTAMSGKRVAL